MLSLFLLAIMLNSSPATAASVKVQVPNPEHLCYGMLDTKKMRKSKFERIRELIQFQSSPQDPVGSLDSERNLRAAKKTAERNLAYVENSVKEIGEFRRPRWKKLGEYYLQKARAEHEKQVAAISFMESWNPTPLLEDPKFADHTKNSSVQNDPGLTETRRDQGMKEAEGSLDSRSFLTCDQKLRLIADEKLVQKFSVNFAYADCAGKTAKDECKRGYIIDDKMLKAERQGKRMTLFQSSWYNNGVCSFTRGTFASPGAYEGPKLEEIINEVVSDVKCEEECPEG